MAQKLLLRGTTLRDTDFLDALGLPHLTEALVANYWPRGGPCWDALAIVRSATDPGYHRVILVEAKSHLPEVHGTGCQATEPSRSRIRRALQSTAEALERPQRMPGRAACTRPLIA